MPYQGAKDDGVSGAFLGTIKGATGLMIKPFAGMFDFISKTADGVKATA